MNQSTTKSAVFSFAVKSTRGYNATGTHDISSDQYGRICAILNEAEIQSAPTDTRSTFSGAADYDQTTPFNGLIGDSQ